MVFFLLLFALCLLFFVFFFKQKTAYEMRISDWSSDVCSSDLFAPVHGLYTYHCQRKPGRSPVPFVKRFASVRQGPVLQTRTNRDLVRVGQTLLGPLVPELTNRHTEELPHILQRRQRLVPHSLTSLSELSNMHHVTVPFVFLFPPSPCPFLAL